MSEETPKSLDRVLMLFPLFGVFLIFLGLLKLDLYYRHFDISIVDYLDFSEILTSFLDDINVMAFTVLIMLTHILIGSILLIQGVTRVINAVKRKRKKKNGQSEEQEQPKEQEEPSTKISDEVDPVLDEVGEFFAKHWIGVLISFVVCTAGYIWFESYHSVFALYFTLLWVFQLVIQLFVWMNDKFLSVREEAPAYIALISFPFFFVMLLTRQDVHQTMTEPETVRIETANEVLTTNDTIIFVGKTDNYVFFFNTVTEAKQIIPVDQITKIEIGFPLAGNAVIPKTPDPPPVIRDTMLEYIESPSHRYYVPEPREDEDTL